MKPLKYTVLGVMLISLLFISLSFTHSRKRLPGEEALKFCETYSQKEILSKLDSKDIFYSWVHTDKADPAGSRIGFCHATDLEPLWNYIRGEAFRSRLPNDLILAVGEEAPDQMIPLYALRKSASTDLFPSQQDIEEVSVRKTGNEENHALLISFLRAGSEKWAKMTRMNRGKAIAILFNGKVIAAPMVREEIKDGKCLISGNYTEVEILQLKAAFED